MSRLVLCHGAINKDGDTILLYFCTPVIATIFKSSDDALKEAAKGVGRTIAAIRAAGVNVLAIKETPVSEQDIPSCLATAMQSFDQGNATKACMNRETDSLKDGPFNLAVKADKQTKNVSFYDAFCNDDGMCTPVVGNVLAYRDKQHFTHTFAKTLAPALERRLVAAVPSLGSS